METAPEEFKLEPSGAPTSMFITVNLNDGEVRAWQYLEKEDIEKFIQKDYSVIKVEPLNRNALFVKDVDEDGDETTIKISLDINGYFDP